MSIEILWFLFGLILLVGTIIWLGLSRNQADWGRRLTNWFDGMIRIFCRRYHRLTAIKLQLESSSGGLLISNHLSGLDPLILITITRRPIRFLIAREEYYRFGLTWVFKLAGCIPVDRAGRVDGAFRQALRMVRAGEIVAFFPHGKIHLDEQEPASIKPGLNKLVQLLKCPVYAVRLTGIRSPGDVFTGVIRRGRVKVTDFGQLPTEILEHPDAANIIGQLLLGHKPLQEN